MALWLITLSHAETRGFLFVKQPFLKRVRTVNLVPVQIVNVNNLYVFGFPMLNSILFNILILNTLGQVKWFWHITCIIIANFELHLDEGFE